MGPDKLCNALRSDHEGGKMFRGESRQRCRCFAEPHVQEQSSSVSPAEEVSSYDLIVVQWHQLITSLVRFNWSD
jgi:hypothetical protein